ncbi:4Fe-4S dicluster domain-containing protein [Methylorubrum suomiense]
MCPSYRATGDEQHLTRGRANSLRLAISGQLGKDAFLSPEMKRTMDLCVSCKACRRECPTGVDMAKMKIEFLHHYHARHGLPLRERLVAEMPRFAGIAAALSPCSTCATAPPSWRSSARIASASRRGARCRPGGGPGAKPASRRTRRTWWTMSATSSCSATPSTAPSSARISRPPSGF